MNETYLISFIIVLFFNVLWIIQLGVDCYAAIWKPSEIKELYKDREFGILFIFIPLVTLFNLGGIICLIKFTYSSHF
jgi:hypothetical protein